MNMHVNFLDNSPERSLDIEEDFHTMSMLPKAVRENDKALFCSKWFDYRFMTPFQATMQYIRDFETVGRRITRREFDIGKAKHMSFLTAEAQRRILDEGKMTQPQKSRLTGFWRGRQVADALCMPYQDYIEQAITIRMRAWQRRHLPNPEQLYEMNLVERVQTKWEEIRSSKTILPVHHAYMVQNYANLPAQNDFHEYLFDQAARGGNLPLSIAHFITEDFLPYEKAKARLSEQVFERVAEYL